MVISRFALCLMLIIMSVVDGSELNVYEKYKAEYIQENCVDICGGTFTEDLQLHSDIVCEESHGPTMIGAALNCNGHSITYYEEPSDSGGLPVTYHGVQLNGDEPSVQNCNINGFEYGSGIYVHAGAYKATIENTKLESNSFGIGVRSDDKTKIKNVIASDNTSGGISLVKPSVKIENVVTQRNYDGIAFTNDAGNSDGAVIKNLISTDNTRYGIYILNDNMKELENIFTCNNLERDIRVLNGVALDDTKFDGDIVCGDGSTCQNFPTDEITSLCDGTVSDVCDNIM